MKERILNLEEIDLFKKLDEIELGTLNKKVIVLNKEKNDTIYSLGDSSKLIFFLQNGKVKIIYPNSGKESIKAIKYPGEMFGEMGMIGEEKRQDIAVALEDNTLIFAFKVDELEKIIKRNNLELEILKTIGSRIQTTESRLISLIFQDAKKRIISFIIELAENRGKKIGDEVLVKHGLTHEDISSLTDTSRQTVTTVLNDLILQNLIYTERGRFLIRDIEKLKVEL